MRKNRQKWLSYVYWLLPIIIIAFQAIYTINSLGQIRTEELIDSVRSVWWFENRLITDGGYTIVGWYTILFVAYNLFGFTLHTAKFVKLAIVLVGLFSVSAVLKKYLGIKASWVPLLTIGLSPTLLFFNTLQVSYGVEVSYFFMCLYLVSCIDFNKKSSLFIQPLLGAVAMLGWLTYPGFINFVFILAGIYVYKLIQKGSNKDKIYIAKNVFLTFAFFLIPFLLQIIYIQNRHLLLYDRTFQRGLFRSNGGLEFNLNLFLDNLRLFLNDLFVGYNSYYFETPKVEFSDYYPIATIIFVIIVSFYVYLKKKKLRFIISAFALFSVFFLIAINLVGPMGLGGVRRGTVLLTMFYLLFGLVWKFILEHKKIKRALRYIFMFICSWLLIHHIVVYPINLSHFKIQSPYRDKQWFAQAETPEKSLELFVDKAKREDLLLQCKDQAQKVISCGGYSLIHAAIEGSCYWNRTYCYKIKAYDTKLKAFVPLSFDFYKNNNWER